MANVSIWDWVNNPTAALEKSCPPTATTLQLTAKADELERGWSTTGFYTWEEMSRMIAAVLDMTRKASSAYEQVTFSTDYTESRLRAMLAAYHRWIERGAEFTQTWQAAYKTNAIIDAPTFKLWVIGTLLAGADLMRAVELDSCTRPFWLGALQAFVGAFDFVISVALAIGKAVVAVGQGVVKAAAGLWSLMPVLKWGLLGFGVLAVGVYGYHKLDAIGQAGRRPIDWSELFKRIPLPRFRRESTATKTRESASPKALPASRADWTKRDTSKWKKA